MILLTTDLFHERINEGLASPWEIIFAKGYARAKGKKFDGSDNNRSDRASNTQTEEVTYRNRSITPDELNPDSPFYLDVYDGTQD